MICTGLTENQHVCSSYRRMCWFCWWNARLTTGSLTIHAIGDHADSLVLDAFEKLGCGGCIEHAQLTSMANWIWSASDESIEK